jgi:hypothetical protein
VKERQKGYGHSKYTRTFMYASCATLLSERKVMMTQSFLSFVIWNSYSDFMNSIRVKYLIVMFLENSFALTRNNQGAFGLLSCC